MADEITAETLVELAPLLPIWKLLEGELANADSALLQRILKVWAARARGYLQERFAEQSASGWPRLKYPRRHRRGTKAKDASAAAPLRDTNTLYAALNPVFGSAPGALEERIPFGVRIGFGEAQHPGGVSIAKLAGWHNDGAGRLPQRKIIVAPPEEVQQEMVEMGEVILAKWVKQNVAT